MEPHSANPATIRKEDGSHTTSYNDTASYLLKQWFRFSDDDSLKSEYANYYRRIIAELDSEEAEVFNQVTEEEIKTVINNLKTDSAPGTDGIPVILIQKLSEVLAPHLKIIFNISSIVNYPF